MEQNNKTEPEYIRAKRGGREQSFTRATWDMLPGKNHQGWEEIIEDPDELKGKGGQGPTAEGLAQIEKALEEAKQKEEDEKNANKETGSASTGAEPQSGIVKALTARQEVENLYKKTFGVETAPKVSAKELQKLIDAEHQKPKEETGSTAPTPDELLKQITKTGGEA